MSGHIKLFSIVKLRGDYTTKLLHETKLETVFHKLFGEIFGQNLLK